MGTESWEADLGCARPPSARSPRRRRSRPAQNLTTRSCPFGRFVPANTYGRISRLPCSLPKNVGLDARKPGISRRIRCAKGDGV